MSVIRVWPKWEGRGGTTDEKGVRTLKRRWGVETDSDATDVPEVIDAVVAYDPTAALYAPHPNWLPALCRSLSAEPNGSGRVWTVDAVYSSAVFAASGDGSGDASNPSTPSAALDNSTPANERAPTISITRKEITEPLETATGQRLINTVGDPFDPQPEVMRSHHLITWKFFRTPAQLDWTNRDKWLDSVNTDAVNILGKSYAARKLRCVEYTVESVWETSAAGLAYYFALTVQAEYAPSGWSPQVLNTGRQQLDSTGAKVAIVDKAGQPVAEPVPLDELGQPVASGGTYYYLPAEGYSAYDWRGTDGTLGGPGGILG